jgi:Na+-driven multidrug efflux pump
MAHFTGVGALLTIVCFYPHSVIPVATFRAAGDTKYSLVLTTSAMFICRVGLAYLLGGYFGLGLYGIWIGMAADLGSRSLINTIHLKRGKWKQKKVI